MKVAHLMRVRSALEVFFSLVVEENVVSADLLVLLATSGTNVGARGFPFMAELAHEQPQQQHVIFLNLVITHMARSKTLPFVVIARRRLFFGFF